MVVKKRSIIFTSSIRHNIKLIDMVALNNIEELINLELHRAHIALGQGLTRKANEHMDNARVLDLKRSLI